MRRIDNSVIGVWCLVLGLFMSFSASAQNKIYVGPNSPSIECTADVHWDRNEKDWPGYLVIENGKEHCVPFTATLNFPPDGYTGDFYVDEFTDAKVREAWKSCETKGDECTKAALESAKSRGEINEFRNTGTIEKFGKIDANGDVDLAEIRRPAYFGKEPYNELISEVDSRTYVVEIEVPSELNEHKFLGVSPETIRKQRGWYIEGAGVDDGHGGKVRALAIMVAGRTIETTAIRHPDDAVYKYNAENDKFEAVQYPNATTENWGARPWRQYLYELNLAGFDVLTLDKRGHGISGGLNASNTLQQARDLYRALDAFESGRGLRIQGSDGKTLEGAAAAGVLMAGQKAKEIPVIIGGPSQGSMVVGFAMHLNFVGDCDFDLAEVTCREPFGYNVKAAIALAEFVKGPGYTDFSLREGVLRNHFNIAYLPTSEILEGIRLWPAVFFGRGLWDFSGGLEGTLDAYNRVTGLKELVVVHGPHSENEYGQENVAYMQKRIVEFAKAVIRDDEKVPGAAQFTNLKELVQSAPPYWEPSMNPNSQQQ